MRRVGRAEGPAQHVQGDGEQFVGVDRLARPDHRQRCPGSLTPHGRHYAQAYLYGAGSSSPEGPSSSLGRLGEDHSHLVEFVDPGRVASGDLGLLFFSAVHQDLLNDLVAPGEGGFDMGIV